MQVNRLIIHQLEKEARQRGIMLYHSSDFLMPIHEGINRLYQLIHDSFEKDKTRHCKYKVDKTSNTVMLNTNKYLENLSDDIFIAYTKASLDVLASRIRHETFATGGYYLFADYNLGTKRYMSIVIARKKDGFNFEWKDTDNRFDFIDTKNVNTDKLAMGYRLNVDQYLNRNLSERNYIALVTNQGEVISDYFLEWVNASDSVSGKIQTNILVNAIKNLSLPEGENDEADFQNRAFDCIEQYRKANKGVINIDYISRTLYGDPSAIRTAIELELNQEIDPEFHVDSGILKKLIQVKAKVKGIYLTIDSSKFSTGEVSLETDVLIIRNQELIRQIWEQKNGQ